MNEIKYYLLSISDERLRNAVTKYMKLYWPKFSKVPASIKHHHTQNGGLLQHTLEVVDFGIWMIVDLKLDVNTEHYLVAALLHDIGKIDRYEYDKESKTWKYFEKSDDSQITMMLQGRRIDHSMKPILEFEAFTKVPLPMEVKLAILSHMGGWSQTSVYPDDLLSTVLHSADLISSRLK